MSVLQIKQHLESILTYMQPYWELVNCHMVNYLTHNHWERFVPLQLRAEVANDTQKVHQCIQTIFWCKNREELISNEFPQFTEFLKNSEKHRLINFEDVLTTTEELRKLFGIMPRDPNTKISIKEFMNEKKRHEVEVAAELLDDIILHSKVEKADMFVIDAGDGKGYLSSRLALQYKHFVLGIDSNEANTKNALERSRKLQRAWNGITERSELVNLGITPPRRRKRSKKSRNLLIDASVKTSLQNYKTTSKFITSDLDFVQLVNEHFPNTPTVVDKPQFCLTGLHTCGNLSPTCLKIFSAQPHFKILCNIGCCYHLLKEEFSGQEFFGNKSVMELQTEPGFPMSSFLKERKVRLGRNARMLAAQSIERTVAAQELPNISVFYRALLEVIISEGGGSKDSANVGKVRKFKNFQEYLEECQRKQQVRLQNINLERAEQLEKRFAADKHYLDLFYLLRMTFSPVLESLILLDRLLYLQELNYKQSFLISLFDAVISPRHFCILAVKN